MKKLMLDADALRVESFAPAADAPQPAGTVRAHDATTTCQPDTSVKIPCFCTEYQTCWNCT